MRPVGRSLLAGVRTIPELFAARVELSSHLPAFRFFTGGGWRSVTWREFANRVEEAALGLIQLGLRAGDTVTIVGETRPEWCICDLAVLSAVMDVASHKTVPRHRYMPFYYFGGMTLF